MLIGIPKETYPGEKRVALTPKVCAQLIKLGHQVLLEGGAGESAGFSDPLYVAAGVSVTHKRREVFERCDLIVQVRGLGANPARGSQDLEFLRPDHTLIGLADPLTVSVAAESYASAGVTSFALELIPRTTKAQSMDVLSSQATLVGYYSVIQAATALNKIFPMLMTAAGTVKAVKVLVLGAGVAGLQAIATSKRLGAIVHGYDLRPAAMEQIQSLGAKVVPLEIENPGESGGYAKAVTEDVQERQRAQLAKFVSESDVVVCTAAVPGKRAPLLISAEMVRGMKHGSVIVDLAAETGGNCELTQAGETVQLGGVSILGPLNVPSEVPFHASELFAQNIFNFLTHLFQHTKDQNLREGLNLQDDIISKTLLTRDYQVTNAQVRETFGFVDSAILSPSQLVANI